MSSTLMAPTLFSRVNTRTSSLNHQARLPVRTQGQAYARGPQANGNGSAAHPHKPELERSRGGRPPVGDFLEYYKPKRTETQNIPDDADVQSLDSLTFNGSVENVAARAAPEPNTNRRHGLISPIAR